MLVKIVKVFPFVAREYTNREGRTDLFKTKGFTFTDGQSTIFAEAVQQTAEYLESLQLVEGNVGNANFTFRARSYSDTKGAERNATEVTLNSFMPI